MMEERRIKACDRGADFLKTLGTSILEHPMLRHVYSSDTLIGFVTSPAAAVNDTDCKPWLAVYDKLRDVAVSLCNLWLSNVVFSFDPSSSTPKQSLLLLQGLFSCERRAFCGPQVALRKKVVKALQRFTVKQLFRFDPEELLKSGGEIPDDIPQDCRRCGYFDALPGSRRCPGCDRPIVFMSKYAVLFESLVYTSYGDALNIPLGCCFLQVLSLSLRKLRQLQSSEKADMSWQDEHYLSYLLTHIIYTLGEWQARSLSSEPFVKEIAYLHSLIPQCLARGDPDLSGEVLDCLNSFGGSPACSTLENFLLDRQEKDGSWNCDGDLDTFDRFHATITAVSGLLKHPRVLGKGYFMSCISHRFISCDSPSFDDLHGPCLLNHDAKRDIELMMERARAAKASINLLPPLHWPPNQAAKQLIADLGAINRVQLRSRLMLEKTSGKASDLRQRRETNLLTAGLGRHEVVIESSKAVDWGRISPISSSSWAKVADSGSLPLASSKVSLSPLNNSRRGRSRDEKPVRDEMPSPIKYSLKEPHRFSAGKIGKKGTSFHIPKLPKELPRETHTIPDIHSPVALPLSTLLTI